MLFNLFLRAGTFGLPSTDAIAASELNRHARATLKNDTQLPEESSPSSFSHVFYKSHLPCKLPKAVGLQQSLAWPSGKSIR